MIIQNIYSELLSDSRIVMIILSYSQTHLEEIHFLNISFSEIEYDYLYTDRINFLLISITSFHWVLCVEIRSVRENDSVLKPFFITEQKPATPVWYDLWQHTTKEVPFYLMNWTCSNISFQRNKKLHGVSRLNLPKYILTERCFQLKT